MNVSSKSIPNIWGMPKCNNKEKAPVPKPIKANLKPKPKMEVPGNRQLAAANPINFTFVDGRFAASVARDRGTCGSGLVGVGYTNCEIAVGVPGSDGGTGSSI